MHVDQQILGLKASYNMDSILTFVTSLLLCATLTAAQRLEPPLHTAIREGQQGRVYCSAQANDDVIQWSHSLSGTPYTFWSSDNPAESSDPRFEVDYDVEDERCDLIVLHANQSVAGTFQVTLVTSQIAHDVEVIVLSGLGCQPDDTGGETQEGGQLIFKAFTTVYGNMVPSMYWYNSGDVRLHSYAYWDEFNVTKTVMSNLSAVPELHQTYYYAELLFEADSSGRAPPVFTDHCVTFYDVLYRPQDIEITPYPEDGEDLVVLKGDHLNCSAIGNPEPFFEWFCSEGSMTSGRRFQVPQNAPDEMQCICRASNELNGQPFRTSVNVTFATSDAIFMTANLMLTTSLLTVNAIILDCFYSTITNF